MVLRKKEVYTICTPIPGFIPRQLAIDILHSHSEVITLNPLVLSHKPIKAPRDAASDEYYSTWYEITERIQYIPGIGKLGSGTISFNGCFHDLPWGLQSHIYAPANVDLRNKYRIAGNQPGVEPPEPQEMGLAALGAPRDGLYLKEDIEIRCNFAMVGFVKAQMKAASKEMVARIVKKAELLDSGVLQAMIEDGRLKTLNPNDRTNTGTGTLNGPKSPRTTSPTSLYYNQSHPEPPTSPSFPYQIPRPMSMQQQYQRPATAGSQSGSYPYYPNQGRVQSQPQLSELQSSEATQIMELPGDYYHPQGLQPPQPSPSFTSNRDSSISQVSSHVSTDPNGWRWSPSQASPGLQHSRPTSISSDAGSMGMGSPGLKQEGFAAELPTHRETREEHQQQQHHPETLQKLDPQYRRDTRTFSYNPADYAGVGR